MTHPRTLGSDEVMISRVFLKNTFSSDHQNVAGMNGSVLCPQHMCVQSQDSPLGSDEPLPYRSGVPDTAIPKHSQTTLGKGVDGSFLMHK